MQIVEMAAEGKVDFAIATEAIELFEDLIMLPCYRWNRCILTPCDHPLREEEPLTLETRLKTAGKAAGLTQEALIQFPGYPRSPMPLAPLFFPRHLWCFSRHYRDE